MSRNVHIHGNTVRRSPVTGGILLVAANTDGCTIEDVWICDNLVEDPDGAAIYLVLDGTQYDDTTFRGIHVTGNRIKLGMPGKSVRAIFLGPGNNCTATTGNVVHDVHIENNQVWVTADSEDLTSGELIFVNDSETASWDVQRLTVRGNRILGNGTGTGIDLRRISNSVVTDNFVANVANGISCVVRGGNMIAGNSSDALSIGLAFNFNGTTGNNTTRDNKVLGTPTTRFNVSGTGTGGDYIELERLAFAASFPGATINDGARYDQDITVAHAALGDQVAAGCTTVNTSGIQVTGNVVAVSGTSGTVRVTIFNHSGSTRTFGAGTIRGSVTRLA